METASAVMDILQAFKLLPESKLALNVREKIDNLAATQVIELATVLRGVPILDVHCRRKDTGSPPKQAVSIENHINCRVVFLLLTRNSHGGRKAIILGSVPVLP